MTEGHAIAVSGLNLLYIMFETKMVAKFIRDTKYRGQ